MGDWMTRAANKTTDAINDGPAHVVTDLYRDPNVKAALEKLFNYKCAYCETPGFAGFSWSVEHFRPKGSVAEDRSHPGYYWLAYTWTNLYPSCVFCNQRRHTEEHCNASRLDRIVSPRFQYSALVRTINEDPAVFGF